MGRCAWDLLIAAVGMMPVEAGAQHNHFQKRKLRYFCTSGWTDAAVLLGKSGSGGNIEAWFTAEGMSDWNINVDIFHKADTKQGLDTVD